MTFCTHCGAQNQDNTQFCTACGSRLGTGEAVAPQPPPDVAPVQPGSIPQPPPWPGTVPAVPAATPYSPPLQPGWNYAQWPDRVVGYLIDSLLVGAGMAVLYLIAGAFVAMIAGLGSDNFAGSMCCMMVVLFPLATFLVGLFNRVYLVSKRGFSIGQGVMKLKVVDANGNLLSMGTAFIRLLAQVGMAIVPFGSLLDLLWPLWDDKRQTLHDKAVGSFVLKQY